MRSGGTSRKSSSPRWWEFSSTVSPRVRVAWTADNGFPKVRGAAMGFRSSEQVTERLLGFKELGVSHMVVWVTGSPASRLESVRRLHEEVRKHLGSESG